MRTWNGGLSIHFYGEDYDTIVRKFDTYEKFAEYARQIVLREIRMHNRTAIEKNSPKEELTRKLLGMHG